MTFGRGKIDNTKATYLDHRLLKEVKQAAASATVNESCNRDLSTAEQKMCIENSRADRNGETGSHVDIKVNA